MRRQALSVAGILLLAALLPAAATTLRRMSVDDLIASSTAIVRATAAPVSSFQRNGMIYTTYRLAVSATLKGSPLSAVELAVPGGDFKGLHQAIAGAPVFRPGVEYVVFYWTGPSGTNYVVGLCQGSFEVHTDTSGEVVLQRRTMSSEVFGADGAHTPDHGLTLRWRDLQAQVAQQSGRQ